MVKFLRDWREVIDVDWPEPKEITERTREVIREVTNSGRYLINDIRIATGRIYTSAEYEAYRARVLSTPLP